MKLDPRHPVHGYAAAHQNDSAMCLSERLACKRHVQDLSRIGDTDFPYVFDDTRMERIYDWFEKVCQHTRGPLVGQHIHLLDWQKFQMGCIAGWVHKDSGARRFRKVFDLRARGNAKSSEASGLALYGMCGDVWYPPNHPESKIFESSPEVECAAVDRGQAKRVWGDAKEMALRSPLILKHLDVKETYVKHKTRGGWMRALSRDTKNKDSGAPTMVILDEYHAHPTSIIHDTLWNSFGKRTQALMVIISTAGGSADTSPCYREYELCKFILEVCAGAQQDPAARRKFDTYFVMIRELEKDDDVHDERIWLKANPILRVENAYSKELRDQIRSEHDAAYSMNDTIAIREWLTKRTNQWQRLSDAYYFERCVEAWEECRMEPEELDVLIRGKDALVGIDLSKRIDLTASVLAIALEDGRIAVRAFGFMPKNTLAYHEKMDKIPYSEWAAQGWLVVTDGDVTDYDWVQTYTEREAERCMLRILEWCMDPANAVPFAVAITRKYGQDAAIDVRQGTMSLNAPTKLFRELVLQRRVVHDGNPLLLAHLMNAVEFKDDKENIRLTKKTKDSVQRIDLAAATMNAMARIQVRDKETTDMDDLFF
jgi:phage terminase large subunit-like protein